MNTVERWLSYLFERVESRWKESEKVTKHTNDDGNPELIKILNQGLRVHSQGIEIYQKGTPEYFEARRIFIALYDYMDIHNDPIDERYRRLYKEVR